MVTGEELYKKLYTELQERTLNIVSEMTIYKSHLEIIAGLRKMKGMTKTELRIIQIADDGLNMVWEKNGNNKLQK